MWHHILIIGLLLISLPASSEGAIITYHMPGRFELFQGSDIGLADGNFEIRLEFDSDAPPDETFSTPVQNDARYIPLRQEIEILGTQSLNGTYDTFFSLVNVQNTFDGVGTPDRFAFVHRAHGQVEPTIAGKFIVIAGLSWDFSSDQFFPGSDLPDLPIVQPSDVTITPSSSEVPQFQVFDSQDPFAASRLYILRDVSLSTTVSPMGDFDGDGQYTCSDINALVVQIAAGSNDSTFDLTGDGVVDLYDRDAWLDVAGAVNLASGNPYLLGDANLDGAVDVSDFNIWHINRWTVIAAYCSGDFNASGAIDVRDFNVWFGNKFQSAGDTVVVPESSGVAVVWAFLAVAARLSQLRTHTPKRPMLDR